MTICIAAIAEKRYAVLAADRTLTTQLEPTEFSHEHSSKLYDLGPGLVVGTAGSPVYIPDLLRLIKLEKGGNRGYMQRVSSAFFKLRREEIEKTILRRFGWDYAAYEKHYSQGNLLEAHARMITMEMDELHVCLHIAAGTVLPNGEASISIVEDPHGAECYDAIGYTAVGSGESYALQVLARANYTSDTTLAEAIFQVFEAKKIAEQAWGVGRRTDIRVVIGPSRSVRLSDEELTQLGRVFDRKVKTQERVTEQTIRRVEPVLRRTLREAKKPSVRAT